MTSLNTYKLRQMRELNRMSITDVFKTTGISRSQICNIETGKADPRISTILELLSCYGGSLSDLESPRRNETSLSEIKVWAQRSADMLARTGIGPSDPVARLERKEMLGLDTQIERESLATRR